MTRFEDAQVQALMLFLAGAREASPCGESSWAPGRWLSVEASPRGEASSSLWQVLAPGRRDRRRRELDEDVRARRARLRARVHVDLVRELVRLAPVARRAGGDDVVPAGPAALAAVAAGTTFGGTLDGEDIT